MDLTDRKKRILKAVVEDYIRTAEPVGSKAIAQEMGGLIFHTGTCFNMKKESAALPPEKQRSFHGHDL